MIDRLIIKGARQHNIKNISLEIPRDTLTVCTGLSGSGKSSLAFDTIFAEGQRRYVESLSSYARQFLGRADKPDVDMIEGISPAVSIDQKSTNRNPRSTVGTITEIYDYLRLLFARAGEQHCPECDSIIEAQSAEDIVNQIMQYPAQSKIIIYGPLVRGRKGEYSEIFKQLVSEGFVRARVDGQVHYLESMPELNRKVKHDIDIVVDRVVVKPESRRRINDSVETAINRCDGLVLIECPQLAETDDNFARRFSEKRACPNLHQLNFDEIEPRTFSFNAPYGACPACDGIGSHLEVDPELVVPDPTATIRQDAVAAWRSYHDHFMRLLAEIGQEIGFDIDTPWQELPKAAQEALLYGKDYKVNMSYRNRWGRERRYTSGFEGAIAFIERKHSETESDWSRERYEGYMREVACSECKGYRLKPEVLSVKFGGISIAQICELSIEDLAQFMQTVQLNKRQAQIAKQILKEVNSRISFMLDVGLGYITLARAAATLSGGEAQRIRLATQIGAGITGVLYVIDEPSIGLHQRDNARLIDTLLKLRDLGNTLLVVEHDEDTIKAADWMVDIGPKAGEHGGEVVYCGPVSGVAKVEKSLTGQYITGKKFIAVPGKRRPVDQNKQLIVRGARENNLQDVTVKFPLGVFTAVTGVSGSGKSTLVNEILYRVLARDINKAKLVPGRHQKVEGLEIIDKVVHVDQSPIGRTPRSNPATYTGVWDHIRKIFALTTEAKIRGYGPGRFSFNVKGGRCETCRGDGTIKIEMNFLPDVYVACEKCHGARYNRETLEVRYNGKTVADVLDMTISEANEFFSNITAISNHLETLERVGLGYVKIGQSATTLSGGEAQRVKLASELKKRSTGKTVYVLDEPTTGLHFEDVRKLLQVLQSLVDKGNTVIVIEHNLDVIKSADWVIDLGPEGGKNGGKIIGSGTPEQISKKASATGIYLKKVIAK